MDNVTAHTFIGSALEATGSLMTTIFMFFTFIRHL